MLQNNVYCFVYFLRGVGYTTEKDANRIRNYIRKNKIPIRPIFTPGKTLKKMFCQSRPLDTVKYVLGNTDRCAICPIITNGICNIQGAVYEISYNLCTAGNITYQGEADRPINYRLKEHIRAASNPTSYPNNAMGQHYADMHNKCRPDFTVSILDTKMKTQRKLSEALYIHKTNPTLNDKSELESVVKFIS